MREFIFIKGEMMENKMKMNFKFNTRIIPSDDMLIDEMVQSYVNLMFWFERFDNLNDFTLDIIMHEFGLALETVEQGEESQFWAYLK